jgi:hypothetical protein
MYGKECHRCTDESTIRRSARLSDGTRPAAGRECRTTGPPCKLGLGGLV